MREDQAKLFERIDDLEPGGFGEQIISGAVGLARLLEQVMWALPEIEARVSGVDAKLDALNQKLDNFVRALDSVAQRVN